MNNKKLRLKPDNFNTTSGFMNNIIDVIIDA